MQQDLFGNAEPPEKPQPPARAKAKAESAPVTPATVNGELNMLGAALPSQLHMGTSSWYFPGWDGLVWDGNYSESTLSRQGLAAYGQHPLLGSVSLDRSFYRPLTASQFAVYAAQVPAPFRFVVKAPSLVTDAVVRAEDGKGMQDNPSFLDPELAVSQALQPALEGLGAKLGVLVFQLSPLPVHWLYRLPEVFERLARMLAALPRLQPQAPDGVVAVEVRNAEFLTPAFAQLLRDAGATYCLGLHAKMPPIEDQLHILRALWPGPLVCRWNLHRKHGAYGYEHAKGLYKPFDKIVDADPETRAVLARVAAATLKAGHAAYVTINNKAEGSAPLSVAELGRAIHTALP